MSVTVKYKGSAIAELTENGTKTLKTSGKYCEADIVVENTKDGGAAITDGIVVKARDAEGYATEVELYNSEGKVPNHQFSCGDYYGEGAPMKNVKTVVFKSPITEIGKPAPQQYSISKRMIRERKHVFSTSRRTTMRT